MPKPVATLLATGLMLAVVFLILSPGRADGRADIQNYLKGPNLFYPRFHDLNGSATKQVIDVLGWNQTRLAGNVGIGNGSVRTFDLTHTYDVEYPENEFMSGDV